MPEGGGIPLPHQTGNLPPYQFFPEYSHVPRRIDTQTDLATGLHGSDFYFVFETGEGNNNGFAFTACEYEHGNLLLPLVSPATEEGSRLMATTTL
jgi:hypothetical protein